MRTSSMILSLLGTVLLAAPLAACSADSGPELGSHEAAIANQEVTYVYYDCAHPDVEVGWRFHACVATNAWSSDGSQSQCFEVDSQDCSNATGYVEYCETGLCAFFDLDDPNLITYGNWASSN